MLRFHPKLGSERGSEWKCFFCLHVRTGTIILGSWHLFLHLVALGVLAAIVRDPRLLDELDRESSPVSTWNNAGRTGDVLPTPLSNVETRPSPYSQHAAQSSDHGLIYHDADMGAMVTVGTMALTLFMIYGAARGKPAYLLPFFCLQIFDFAITILTATGYLCYLREIHALIMETRRVPFREELLQLPAPVLAFVVMSALIVAVIIKGYCISVVWRCYKYLTMRTAALQSLTPFVISGDGIVTSAPAPPYSQTTTPDYSSLLPDYEEAVKQTPPPSYRAATLMAVTNPEAATVSESRAGEQGSGRNVASSTVVMLPQDGAHARV